MVSDRFRIWATTDHRPPYKIEMVPASVVAGTMTIHDDGTLSNRTGYLSEGT
ncbi:MAG: hypothetical protein ACRDPT_15945 [Streptomycetales bacterium]